MKLCQGTLAVIFSSHGFLRRELPFLSHVKCILVFFFLWLFTNNTTDACYVNFTPCKTLLFEASNFVYLLCIKSCATI